MLKLCNYIVKVVIICYIQFSYNYIEFRIIIMLFNKTSYWLGTAIRVFFVFLCISCIKKLLDTILYVPLVIPEIVMGISLLAFFATVKVPLGKVTLVIAHVTFSIAYVVAVVKTRLDGFDKSVEEAAMDLGATPLKTFFMLHYL